MLSALDVGGDGVAVAFVPCSRLMEVSTVPLKWSAREDTALIQEGNCSKVMWF